MLLLALPVTFQRPALMKVAPFQLSPTIGIVHLDCPIEQGNALPAFSPGSDVARRDAMRRGVPGRKRPSGCQGTGHGGQRHGVPMALRIQHYVNRPRSSS